MNAHHHQSNAPGFDPYPERELFPFGFQFSNPAIYHTPDQTFQIGDTVFYEVNIPPSSTNIRQEIGIQWGEAVIKDIIHESNNENDEDDDGNKKTYYKLAGKTWSYDHYTHPYAGTNVNLPSSVSPSPQPHHNHGSPMIPNMPMAHMPAAKAPSTMLCPIYQNIQNVQEGRQLYRNWATNHHPNAHVRRAALQGVDEVMHPDLARVPKEAMFKVWDRETRPRRPIALDENSTTNSTSSADLELNDQEDGNNSRTLEQARKRYGPDLQFSGAKQNGYGPEMWGVTFDQLESILTLPGFTSDMSMYDVVVKLVIPMTKGKGVGYALLVNGEKPLRAKQMTSHAWGESYEHFVMALKGSNVATGPFWVCALAIYQCEDVPDLTISKQIGTSLENGPFATVLKQATEMIAVFTPAVDIYLRMWCVFEISIAVKYDVPVRFAAFSGQFRSGIENIYDSIYEHGRKRCKSIEARCGNPAAPMNDDEKQIRNLINSQSGKFDRIDATVEWCKATYHIGQLRHPGSAFQSEPAHLLLMGGRKKYDFLAKTLSSIALALDRIPSDVKYHSTACIGDEFDDDIKNDRMDTNEKSCCCECVIT